jgi:hypothetical protein
VSERERKKGDLKRAVYREGYRRKAIVIKREGEGGGERKRMKLGRREGEIGLRERARAMD